MSDRPETSPTSLGIYDRLSKARITGVEVIALVLSVLWLGAAGLFFLLIPSEGNTGSPGSLLQFVMTILAIFLPLAMIWVAAVAARSTRVMREESVRLQAAIDAIRHAYVAQNQTRNTVSDASVARKLDEIAAAQRKTETAIATFSTSRGSTPVFKPNTKSVSAIGKEDQVALPLGTSAEDIQPPLERKDFIRALNFPETVNDKEGFAALRRALKDRSASQLVQASQDVLTLLSQEGIYMDDLRPDLIRPEVWRRFAEGERGRSIAALGGVRDRSSLALTGARMRNDGIFRDAAHHFLRRFDTMFAQFAETATDAEISELSNTRTARAFMLLGRVAGTFN
ncbi:hypothetical protein ROA7450_01199 [Roseovarius albus]|uniref:Uncharacterized protein n=1 Tax=Roseovarius albus TaxID=1247867 RepID=A0A1X6YR84_9RHOB|nr:hypothetical protein [Roseovarius albus]SLN28733.1 hypothetical protein ROA7450_01199 [Roseovarius albus]